MSWASRRPGLVMAGLALAVVATLGAYLWFRLSHPLELDAPAPIVVADLRDAAPRDSASTIEALVTYNVATAVESLEAVVPSQYGDIAQKLPVPGNTRAGFAYSLRRSPFRVRVIGPTLSLSADVEYEGRVWYRPPVGPELSAGCGRGDSPKPRVSVTLSSSGRLTPGWQLRTRTRVLRLEPASEDPSDRCRLTVLRIDVTDRVIEATRRMLEHYLLRFDDAVSRWPVRPKFVKLWEQLQRPIRLTDDVYLEINPTAAQLGSLGEVRDTAQVRLRVIASPRIVTGEQRDPVHPLPPLQTSAHVGTGAHVSIEASFSYPVATALLRRSLVGRSLVQDGHRIRIQNVELSGIGGGRVALSVTLSGRVRGRLYFTGTPHLDPVRHQVNVPDLDYDVGTSQMLVQGFAWLNGMDMRDFLRARASLPDSAVVGRLRALAEHGFHRTLAPGVLLSGRIHAARGTNVRATTREIRVRAVADAEFKLAIDRAPRFPKVRAPGKNGSS